MASEAPGKVPASTFEFLPLAILFLHRTWRDGGRHNAVGAVVCVTLQAASGSYLLVYAILFALGILAFGRHFGPAPTAPSIRRLLAVGAACGAAVAVVAWPLPSSAISAWPAGETVVSDVRRPRGNDLLGFNWMIEASPIVSWPSVFGYSTLLLVAAGFLIVQGIGRTTFSTRKRELKNPLNAAGLQCWM